MATSLNSSTHNARSRAAFTRRLFQWVYGFVAVVLLGTTIVYGQSWLLEESPTPAIECAFVSGVARALHGEFANN
jgi:hypothetical protein